MIMAHFKNYRQNVLIISADILNEEIEGAYKYESITESNKSLEVMESHDCLFFKVTQHIVREEETLFDKSMLIDGGTNYKGASITENNKRQDIVENHDRLQHIEPT